MSERYGTCSHCQGTGSIEQIECSTCGGTGHSGDAMEQGARYLAIAFLVTALLSVSFNASAHDWEHSEGHFLNRKDERVACYGDDKNHPGQICRRYILKSESCLGDAVGAGDGAYVFKVPNRSSFFVDGEEGIVIQPANLLSTLLLKTARELRPGRYGWMAWSHFIKIMGNREVVSCESEEVSQCQQEVL